MSMNARKWGAGTAAITRALIAARRPIRQADLAAVCNVSQPRVSQVLAMLTANDAAESTDDGWIATRAAVEMLADRHAPRIARLEYCYSLAPARVQAANIARVEPDAVFTADVAADMLAPWRHPTHTVAYISAASEVDLDEARLAVASPWDYTTILWYTDDADVLHPASRHGDLNITHHVQVAADLIRLTGEDRREAAHRILERALVGAAVATS